MTCSIECVGNPNPIDLGGFEDVHENEQRRRKQERLRDVHVDMDEDVDVCLCVLPCLSISIWHWCTYMGRPGHTMAEPWKR